MGLSIHSSVTIPIINVTKDRYCGYLAVCYSLFEEKREENNVHRENNNNVLVSSDIYSYLKGHSIIGISSEEITNASLLTFI